MASINDIVPCLWFDGQAEEAAKLYVSVFADAGIDAITSYDNEGFEIHGRPAGSVMTVELHLGPRRFTLLNGGPQFKFNEAVSFQVMCETQEEVDHFWSRLTAGGGEEGPCGWLKDRFGLSWQVVPTVMNRMIQHPDVATRERVTRAFLRMKKLDIAELKRAYEGS